MALASVDVGSRIEVGNIVSIAVCDSIASAPVSTVAGGRLTTTLLKPGQSMVGRCAVSWSRIK